MTNIIEMKNIWKVYKTGLVEYTALKGIDLTIKKSSFTSIVGPSGSGKSTLMNIIGLLDIMDKGSYKLNDRNILKANEEELSLYRNIEIGFIFQSFNLLPRLNILENVELPLIYQGVKRKERKIRALEALESVGLKAWRNHRPGEISGGQKQRVAIARATVTKPSILLCDEPTGNLDTKSSNDIMDIIKGLHKTSSTIILITHEPSIAKIAEETITIKDGEIEI